MTIDYVPVTDSTSGKVVSYYVDIPATKYDKIMAKKQIWQGRKVTKEDEINITYYDQKRVSGVDKIIALHYETVRSILS